MKLRIRGNSIRLRLGRSEVLRLAGDGTVEEYTVFGPSGHQRFGYALCASTESLDVNAIFSHGCIVVRVPVSVIHTWIAADQVRIQSIQRTSEGSELRILIEKDFECIDASPDESQEDAFPHPQLMPSCANGK